MMDSLAVPNFKVTYGTCRVLFSEMGLDRFMLEIYRTYNFKDVKMDKSIFIAVFAFVKNIFVKCSVILLYKLTNG